MCTRTTVFLLLAVCCVAVQYVVADEPEKDPCQDPIIPGKITQFCDVISFHYAYDASANECVQNRYTGCKFGSDNDFRTKAECESKCVK